MTKCLRFVLAICVATTLHFTASAQSLSINNTGATADPSAILDVTSTVKGMLIPRMDKTAKNAIATPANGLMVYQTGPDSIGFHYYDLPNTQWVYINASGFAVDTTAWKITGNSNITASSFLGTLNDSALRFKVKNMPSGIVDSASANTALGYQSLASITSGVNNTVMGVSALRADTSGSNNIAIGLSALRNKVNGSNNVAIGVQSSLSADTVINTTAIGRDALYYNEHHNNFAVGSSAGAFVDLQPAVNPTTEVTYVGTEAGYGFWVGKKSTGVGYRALWNYDPLTNTVFGSTVGRNTAIGDSAMALTYSSRNVAVGTEALSRARVSSQNVAIGDSSMGGALNTAGNVAIGYKTLNKQQGQGWNTAVGYFSQRDSSNSTYYNTSIGAYSMEYNRTGIFNTGLGLSTLRLTDSASYNTAVGADAMYFHRKNGSNLAAGAFAMRGDSAGYWNTAVGSEAMDRYGADGSARGTGFSNVAVGFRALRGAREAFENTAVGVGALESDSSGNYNTAVGRYSSFLNKRGDFNVSLGFRASNNADTASFTTAIGAYAGAKNKRDYNVTIGYAAGYEAGGVGGFDPKEMTFVGYEAGRGVWASHKNTALGFRALSNTDAGFGFYDYFPGRNTAIGDSAMAFSIGASNVVVGAEALANSGVAGTWNNVAIGDSAMGAALSNGGALADNVAIGYRSLTQVKNQGNIAIGAYSGRKLANTIWNTAIGYHALETDTTGSENTVIGTSAFRNNANGVRNVSLGINTGYWATGNDNTYIGSYAGQGVSGRSTGNSNVAVGDYALLNVRSAAQNVAIGESALGSDSTGNLNVAVGAGAMDQRLRGDGNVAVGFWAGRLDTASERNVYIGREAGYNSQREGTIAIGYQALYNNSNGASIFEGIENTAIGTQALSQNTTGNYNVAIGNFSQYQSTSTGGFNTSIGSNTLYALTSGANNTVVGSNAMSLNTTGSRNTAMGTNAMFNTTTGGDNTGIGHQSLFENISGASNTAVGKHAGRRNTTGNKITVIGDSADVASVNLDNATAIGYRAMVGASNSMVLGGINGINSATATTSVGIGVNTPGARLHVRRNGASGGSFIGNPSMIIEDNTQSYVQLSNPTNSENGILSGSAISTIRSGIVFGIDSAMFLRTGGNINRMLIDNNGYVGVGTTAPNPLTQFHLHEPLNANVNLRVASSGSSFEPGLELVKTGGGSDWKIRTTIAGNLMYARTTDDFVTSTDYYQMSVGSFIPFIDANNALGGAANRWTTVYATVGAINTSDARDKENITDLNYGLKEVMKLRPVSFSWKENPQWGKKIGFIAQEVQPVLQEVIQVGELKSKNPSKDADNDVAKKETDKLGIYYSDIIPVTVKAIQEQQQTIQSQQKTIDDLKKKNEQLEKDMQLIKAKLGINN